MASTVILNEASLASIDALIGTGRFDSVDQVVETAIAHLAHGHGVPPDVDDEIDPDAEADALTDVSEEDREAIREGLRDGKEGRVLTIEQVFDPLIARLRAMAEDRLTGTNG